VSWTTADIPDLSNRTAVVTGANGGLGLETARALAAAGAHVVMAVRDQDKAAAAVADINDTVSDPKLTLVALDLASQQSVHQAAAQIAGAHERIDILVNNAGVMAIPERRTEEGFEMQFAVNHLGHWTLTGLLLPALLRAEAARIVTVTSTAHHMGRPVNPANVHLQGRYRPWRAYGQSKLANFHFGLGLQRQLSAANSRAASLIAHPGLSNTELQVVSMRETPGGFSQRLAHRASAGSGMSAAIGALSQLRAATDPAASGGQFYGPLFVNNGPPVRKPILRRLGMRKAIATLWAVSERDTGVTVDVAGAAAVAG
jgi:NAD(P)-dependent dehydrogenase (short-subunit alcohol dehydrogenase family)